MEGAGPPRIDERRDAGGGDVDDECNEPPLPTPTSLLEGRGGEGGEGGDLQAWWIIIQRARQHAKFDFHRFESKFYFIFDAVFFFLIAVHFFPSCTLFDSMLELIVVGGEEFGID